MYTVPASNRPVISVLGGNAGKEHILSRQVKRVAFCNAISSRLRRRLAFLPRLKGSRGIRHETRCGSASVWLTGQAYVRREAALT